MPVLIDQRVCDNNQACSAMRICPNKAIVYNYVTKTVESQPEKCGTCPGFCTRFCPAGAIKYVATMEELESLRQELAASTLTKDDLLEQKYGIRPGDPRETGINLIHVNCDDFRQEVLQSDLPVVVDFWAEWCAPCRIIAPTFKELAEEYNGRMRFAKMDTEECQIIPAQYGIMSIPTLLFFARGKIVDQVVGAVPKAHLKKKIEQVISRYSVA